MTALLDRILNRLGLVTNVEYNHTLDLLEAAEDREDSLRNDLDSLYWRLGMQRTGFPPLRWRKLNEPPDERFAEACRRIDALKAAA